MRMRISSGASLFITSILSMGKRALLGLVSRRRIALFMALLPWMAKAHGTFHEMMDEMQSELAQRPHDPELLLSRAALEVEHGDWQAAMVDLEKVERTGTEDVNLPFLRGRALAAGKMWTAAKQAMDEFITTHPMAPLARLERARVLTQLGENKAALQDYRASLKLFPQPEPDLIVEVTDALVAQSLTDEALQVVTDGVAKLGNVPQLVLKALELELAARRYDEALSRVDSMAKMMPRPEPWLARRASVLAQAGRLDASRAEWLHLRERILALPNLERGSHAMSKLLDEANTALVALSSTPTKTTPAARP